MINSIEKWMNDAWTELIALPDISEVVAHQRTRWGKFQNLNTLEIVLFGAYDAGKSSILKRLLVDWGIAVPEWLIISGRKETFETNRVEVDGFGLVDTPGLGTGNSKHDELTLDAMRLADAYLWVLPPQLVTTEKERFLEILFGEIGIADVTIAVIARMDEAGIDPGENEAGFADLCRKKKEELTSLIEHAVTSHRLHSIHCVVADPYQMVGRMAEPNREVYDVSRDWDGIADLVKDIDALRARHSELRISASARYVRCLVDFVCGELQRLAEELTLNKKGIENEIDRHTIYRQRLEAMQRQARAELHRKIEDALLFACRSGDGITADSISTLEDSLRKVVDEWAEGSYAEYTRLAGELELDAREHLAGPSMDGFRHLAEEAEKGEYDAKEAKIELLKTGWRPLAFSLGLREAFEKYAMAELGMTLKEAAERLEKLELSGETVKDFIKSQGRVKTFRSIEHAKKASQFVKWGHTIDAISPIVVQLAKELIEVINEIISAKKAKERAQRRLMLRRELRIEAEMLEKSAVTGFDLICGGLRKWLEMRHSSFNDVLLKLSQQIEHYQELESRLDNIRRTYPKKPTAHCR